MLQALLDLHVSSYNRCYVCFFLFCLCTFLLWVKNKPRKAALPATHSDSVLLCNPLNIGGLVCVCGRQAVTHACLRQASVFWPLELSCVRASALVEGAWLLGPAWCMRPTATLLPTAIWMAGLLCR